MRNLTRSGHALIRSGCSRGRARIVTLQVWRLREEGFVHGASECHRMDDGQGPGATRSPLFGGRTDMAKNGSMFG
eukprot:symbB.v1.2.039365.t1/scaffold6517.1/size17445/1